ncbi:MAG: hypothetical protein J6W58_01620 [Lachnospiraceae bacterium]|jgi:membrane protease YdiL (CAAX protease family)|nr:hypothetical protein [Lachnospiraceae bacterium]
MNKNIKEGFFDLLMVLIAFAGLGFEAVLAFMIEPLLYGCDMKSWSVTQNVIHWILTCIVWGLTGFLVIRLAKRFEDFDIFKKGKKMKRWQWLLVILIIIFSLIISYIDWNGSKVLKEFNANGPVKFVFQYIYYCFEVVLVTLILIFGQLAFEKWFKRKNIPYGGIVVALTWGIAHIFTKNLYVGIITMISGLAFGSVYLLTNRDIKISYVILWFIFVL